MRSPPIPLRGQPDPITLWRNPRVYHANVMVNMKRTGLKAPCLGFGSVQENLKGSAQQGSSVVYDSSPQRIAILRAVDRETADREGIHGLEVWTLDIVY